MSKITILKIVLLAPISFCIIYSLCRYIAACIADNPDDKSRWFLSLGHGIYIFVAMFILLDVGAWNSGQCKCGGWYQCTDAPYEDGVIRAHHYECNTCGKKISFLYSMAPTQYDKWNNGTCDCGGHLSLKYTDKLKGHDYYFYQCNSCGKKTSFEYKFEIATDSELTKSPQKKH